MKPALPKSPKRRKPRKPRRPAKRVVVNPGTYSRDQIVVGICGTILAHVWLLLLATMGVFKFEPSEAEDPYKDFSIVLDQPVEEEEEFAYTQTNPDVPENEPDDTSRFGARSQQAANPDEPEDLDPNNRPATESDDNIETDQFLSGSLEEPVVAPPPASNNQQQEDQTQQNQPSPDQPLLQAIVPSEQAQKKEIPIFGSLEDADPDEQGIADYDYDKLKEAPTNVTDFIDGEAEEGEEDQSQEESPETVASRSSPVTQETVQSEDGIPSPRARPTLPRIPTGPVRDSRLGVSSIGQLSVDAKASKFGEYMERLIETVKLNWDDLVHRSSAEERKSVVKIRFILTQDGLVDDIEILDGTTARAIGIYMCREAILRGVPYGPWPAGLVEMFGEDEDITFNFHYY